VSVIVYSTNLDLANYWGYSTFSEYKDKNSSGFINEQTLNSWRSMANSILNQWIGCYNQDISDSRFTDWLKRKEIEVMLRIRDKQYDRKTRPSGGIYPPHDYLYRDEREYCMKIGIETGNRVFGGTSIT